jgi:large subunit ribosomal protein L32
MQHARKKLSVLTESRQPYTLSLPFARRTSGPAVDSLTFGVVMQPVQRISKSRKRKRRSHHALTPIHYVRCPQCGNPQLPHRACDNCGFVNPKLQLQMETEKA